MYLILFLVGIVLAFAGAVLIRYAVPVVDAGAGALFTSGIVAFVGGLILMGLAAAVRTLGRIAERLEIQPLPLPPVAAVGREDPAPRPARQPPAAGGRSARASLAARLVRPRERACAGRRRGAPAAAPVADAEAARGAARSISRRSPACRRSRASRRRPCPRLRRRRQARPPRQGRPKPVAERHPRDDGLQVRRDRRHGLYAVHGRLDRGRAAARQGQVRLGRRTAEVSDDARS